MKADIDPGMAVKSAATMATVPWLDAMSSAIFGVPVSVWAACFSGSMFTSTFFRAEHPVSRPLAIILFTIASAYVTGMVIGVSAIASRVPPGVGFVVSAILPLALPAIGEVAKRIPGELWDRVKGVFGGGTK